MPEVQVEELPEAFNTVTPEAPEEAPKQRLLKSLINNRIFAWCPELAKRRDMVEI